MSRVRGAISAIVTDHRSAFAVVAGIVGAVVGLAAVIFNWLIAVWMRATTGAADYSVTGGAPHGWPAWTHILIIAVPVVSALMYGPMIWRWAPTAKGHGIPEVMLAVRRRGGKTWPLCLAYAKALGALRAGAIKTTFTEETETDLFGEQDVLMGGINHLCDLGFDVLTEAGYQPEIAYFEVFHELKMLVDLANEGGLNKARWSCSDTAQYGDYTSTVITDETKKRMQYQLKRIQDGSFAKEFMDDQAAGAPKFKKLQEEFSHPHLETVGPKLRAMFSWNNAEAKDKDEAESFNGKIARTQVQ